MQTYSRKDIGHFSDLDQKKWCGSNTYKPNGEWDDVAEHMLLSLSSADIPYSVEPVRWNEEICEANQVERIYATNSPGESLVVQKVTRKLVAQNNSETMVAPTDLSTTSKTPRMLRGYERKFANLPDDLRLIRLWNWQNWMVHVESTHNLQRTSYPK